MCYFGLSCGKYDMRIIVKGYLDHRGVKETRFKENTPGNEWAVIPFSQQGQAD